jgi:hypothetical protein
MVDHDADEPGRGPFGKHDFHVRVTVVEHLLDLVLELFILCHICTLIPERGRKKRRVGAHLDDRSRNFETTLSVALAFSR